MAVTYTKDILSGSTDGLGVLVVATASSGTTIHTGASSTSVQHEVWLYASNPDAVDHVLTVQWGGTTDPNDSIKMLVKAYEGLRPVVPGLVLKGNATPKVIRAFADTASKVVLHGFVNVITTS